MRSQRSGAIASLFDSGGRTGVRDSRIGTGRCVPSQRPHGRRFPVVSVLPALFGRERAVFRKSSVAHPCTRVFGRTSMRVAWIEYCYVRFTKNSLYPVCKSDISHALIHASRFLLSRLPEQSVHIRFHIAQEGVVIDSESRKDVFFPYLFVAFVVSPLFVIAARRIAVPRGF